MNKKFLLLVCMLVFFSFAYCEKVRFDLKPYAGLEYSIYEEAYYFDVNTGYSDKMCSLLEWEQKPSWLLGLASSACFFNFETFIDVSTKIPMECGSMKDSDFLNDGMKFNYSVHELYLNKSFNINAGISYFIDFSFINIKPGILASYSYNTFSAKNGHGWYGSPSYSSDGKVHSWNSGYAHYFPDGKYHLAGVDYENQTVSLMIGAEVSKTFMKIWTVGLGAYLSPFTYAYAKDHHLGKSRNFYTEDFIYNYFKNYRFALKNNVSVTKHLSFESLIEGNLQLLEKGEDYEDGYLNSQKGGESYKAVKSTLGFVFTF